MTTPDTDLTVLEALHSTPARRFLSQQPIPDEILWELLDAAVRGPSGGNSQAWAWVVVRDPEKKRRIAEWYREGWEKHYGFRREQMLAADADAKGLNPRVFKASDHLAYHLEEAPVWVIPALIGPAKSTNPLLGSSVYGAVQQLMLAARAYGIGTTLTTLHSYREDDVRKELGLPENAITMALIPLGYPEKGRWAQPKRRPLADVVHWDTFGEQKQRPVSD